MKGARGKRAVRALAALVILFAGCANTIPLRSQNAIPIHPTALYPVRVAMKPFKDGRPSDQKASPKRVTWPGMQGRMDYFGEGVDRGLAESVADYLTASRLFNQVLMADFIATEQTLKSLGYRALLTGRIQKFEASLSVPKLVMALAIVPNPLFFILPGITLLPLAVWPKGITFDAKIADLRLKDLNTGLEIWSGKVDIHREMKKLTRHFSAPWYLGETAEMISKELVGELARAKLKF